MSFPEQLFVIPHETLAAVSWEELDATYAAMVEMNIAQPPFADYDVQLAGIDGLEPTEEARRECSDWEQTLATASVRFCFRNERIADWYIICKSGHQLKEFKKYKDSVLRSAVGCEQLLVVLLATKNVQKDTKTNKAVRLGGAKKRHLYETTLRLGQITEQEGCGTHASPRPHLRRGHVRNQAVKNGHKQIFIQPVFVNADEGWISARTQYRIKA